MGSLMEVVNVYYKKLDVQWKPAWDDWEESISPRVVAEMWPYGIMWAGDALRREGRAHFPMLSYVWRRSKAYVDESLWLRPEQVLVLLVELQRLRRLCRYGEFIQGIDGRQVYERWREDYYPQERFEADMDEEERLLERAILEDYWVHLET
jgi:hypothetical protein